MSKSQRDIYLPMRVSQQKPLETYAKLWQNFNPMTTSMTSFYSSSSIYSSFSNVACSDWHQHIHLPTQDSSTSAHPRPWGNIITFLKRHASALWLSLERFTRIRYYPYCLDPFCTLVFMLLFPLLAFHSWGYVDTHNLWQPHF